MTSKLKTGQTPLSLTEEQTGRRTQACQVPCSVHQMPSPPCRDSSTKPFSYLAHAKSMALIRSKAWNYNQCLHTLTWANEKDKRNTISFPNPCVLTYCSCTLELLAWNKKQSLEHPRWTALSLLSPPEWPLRHFRQRKREHDFRYNSDTIAFHSEHSPLKLRLLIQILLSTTTTKDTYLQLSIMIKNRKRYNDAISWSIPIQQAITKSIHQVRLR